jgi:hypothetical protein
MICLFCHQYVEPDEIHYCPEKPSMLTITWEMVQKWREWWWKMKKKWTN